MSFKEKIKYYLFYFLLILIPFNFHHVFNFEQIKGIEGFRENISYSLYAFDIVFIALLLISISTYIGTLIGKFLRKKPVGIKGKFLIVNYYLQITLVAFSSVLFISSFFSKNQPVSFYNSSRIIEVVIFFMIVKDLLKSEKILGNSAAVVFFSGIFQSIIAIFQFIFQKSIGLKILGESIIAPNIFGVAKIEIYGEKMIRAYGTFPHPNLLGAFLLLSLACGIYLISQKQSAKIYRLIIHYWPLVSIAIAIISTFSRSIWLATFLFLTVLLFFHFLKIKAFKIHLKFKIQNSNFYKKIVVAIPLIFFLSLFISPRLCINCPGDESYALRKLYSQTACKIIQTHLFIGIGPGNFTSAFVSCNCPCGPQPWEIQPVHNLYLLITSETGFIGFTIFLLILAFASYSKLKLDRYTFRSKTNELKIKKIKEKYFLLKSIDIFFILFLSLLFLGLFDHYFWTLPQGQFIFWLALAMAITKNKISREQTFSDI